MFKEFFICAAIILVIIIGNSVTQSYSVNSIEEMNNHHFFKLSVIISLLFNLI